MAQDLEIIQEAAAKEYLGPSSSGSAAKGEGHAFTGASTGDAQWEEGGTWQVAEDTQWHEGSWGSQGKNLDQLIEEKAMALFNRLSEKSSASHEAPKIRKNFVDEACEKSKGTRDRKRKAKQHKSRDGRKNKRARRDQDLGETTDSAGEESSSSSGSVFREAMSMEAA